jgi:hypothetical protein
MSDSPGRNDPCHCGSGRKYKNCCRQKDNSAVMSKVGIGVLVIAVVLGLWFLGSALSGGNDGTPDCPTGQSWSEAHQHCH